MILKLDKFEGPLDLLLHLIEKHELDIYDIRISELTDQYINYIENYFGEMDSMSEFIWMAATLLEIKSKMLLPKPKKEIEDESEIDPREELVNKLIEYKRFKLITESLKENYLIAEKSLFKLPDYETINSIKQTPVGFNDVLNNISLDKLFATFQDVFNRREPKSEKIFESNTIYNEVFLIEDKITYITNILFVKRKLLFSELFNSCYNKPEKIVVFLAVLEMSKMNVLLISQSNFSDDFILSIGQSPTSDEVNLLG